MNPVGSITTSAQAVYTSVASRRVTPAVSSAPVREAAEDGDRSPPRESIWAPEKGGIVDLYA